MPNSFLLGGYSDKTFTETIEEDLEKLGVDYEGIREENIENFNRKVNAVKSIFDKEKWAIGGLIALVVVLVISKLFD